MSTICIVQGHPSASPDHYVPALAQAYENGAKSAGRSVCRIDIAALDFPVLRTAEDWETQPNADIHDAQQKILSAKHMVVMFPLWMGGMPAYTRAFFEQIARAGFAITTTDVGWPRAMLAGRSARVVVTMGMPAAAYRWGFGAFGVRAFERVFLGLAGFRPIKHTFIGGVGALGEEKSKAWLTKIETLGYRGG